MQMQFGKIGENLWYFVLAVILTIMAGFLDEINWTARVVFLAVALVLVLIGFWNLAG